MKITKILLFFSCVMCLAVNASAQDYPSKPVQLIVPFTAGSATDFVGRTVGQELSKIWGQPVTFNNRPGAGGTVGADVVAKAPADGYTLLISAAYVASPALYAKLPYNPLKDFVDIAPLARQPMALVVSSSSGVQSVTEVINTAKAASKEIKFGSPGTGSIAHLAGEKFKSAAGINVVHVSCKGGPGTITATEKGSVTYSFLPIALALKGVKAGKLRALGVTSAERVSAMPDVPTISESGIAGSESTIWWGIWAPAGISGNIADKLEKDIKSALAASEVRKQFKKRSLEPMSMTSAEFSKFVNAEMKSVANIVKEAGITPK
jgi:tripartite-type tricarboxylate transporter receptor subunit TctC